MHTKMQHLVRSCGLVAVVLVAVVGIATAYAASSLHFSGQTSQHKAVSFRVKGGYVTGFRFVNRCPSDSNAGTLVPGRMRISHGKFSRHDGQFTITGRISGRTARGTAKDVTGDCNSGLLHWHAKR